FLDVVSSRDAADIYPALVTHWKDARRLVPGSKELATRLSDRSSWPRIDDFVQNMSYVDTVTYLTNDITVKGDRASMHGRLRSRSRHPLEGRAPAGAGIEGARHPPQRPLLLAPDRRFRPEHDLPGYRDLSYQRHHGEGRPGQHAREPRIARPFPGP